MTICKTRLKLLRSVMLSDATDLKAMILDFSDVATQGSGKAPGLPFGSLGS